MDSITELINEVRSLYVQDNLPWILQVSFGKDSAFMTTIVWKAVSQISIERRTKPIYIISSDTMVETPVMSQYVQRSISLINRKAKEDQLPIYAILVKPHIKSRFFYKVLGRGTLPPSPKVRARWCTEHLKIRTTKETINDIINQTPIEQVLVGTNNALLFLGVRDEESVRRKASIEAHQIERDSKYARHSIFPNLLCYHPIRDVLVDEIWLYLMENEELPYGMPVSELAAIYGESFGECGVGMKQDKACGAVGSRSGCWVCPLSKYEDPMLQALIKEGHHEYSHLLHWKQRMIQMRNDVRYRENLRRVDFEKRIEQHQGTLFNNDPQGRYDSYMRSLIEEYSPGPFTFEARLLLLEYLLYTQSLVQQELISEEEIEAILETWAAEGFYVDREDLYARDFEYDGSLILNPDGSINTRETTVKHPIYRVRIELNMEEPLLLKFLRERQNSTRTAIHYFASYQEHENFPIVYNSVEFIVCRRGISSYKEALNYVHRWLGWHSELNMSRISYKAGLDHLIIQGIKESIEYKQKMESGNKECDDWIKLEEENGQLSFAY